MGFARNIWPGLLALAAAATTAGAPALAQQQKPNILVIMADDIGYWNISAYNRGMMGYRTPNIDRIANEGMRFTDSYGEQSCTAGRAAFISGQSVYRTGMSKVGVPGVDIGWAAEDPATDRANCDEVLRLYEAGLLRPHVGGRFGADQARAAIDELKYRRAIGKVVVAF